MHTPRRVSKLALLGRGHHGVQQCLELRRLSTLAVRSLGGHHQCIAFAAAGLLAEAVADCSAVLAAEPANVDAAYQRGAARHKLGALEDAIADFTTVLSLDPRHAKAAYSRAACNNLAGNFDAANGERSRLWKGCARCSPSLCRLAV